MPKPELPPQFYSSSASLTDRGNAARFIFQHHESIRLVRLYGKWFVWDEIRWRPETGEAVRFAMQTAMSIFPEADSYSGADHKRIIAWGVLSNSERAIGAMLRIARSGLYIAATDFDRDPWLLNVQNGTIDLRTGTLRPHSRTDFCTKLAPVDHDSQATAPLWDSFLARIMENDAPRTSYIQRILGMCLTGTVHEQVVFIFQGTGANGKSVLLDTIAALMGDYATEAAPNLLIASINDRHPTEVADLQGRRLVVVGETEEGRRLQINLMKQLTGNARLKARFMRQDFFEFTRTHKMILATNNRPRIRESSYAAWRRLRLVPFNVVIPPIEQDKHLLDKLRSEWSGILNWAIQGCASWQKQGLHEPKAIIDATDGYKSEQALLPPFLEAYCIFSPDAYVSRHDIYVAYLNYAAEIRDRSPLSDVDLYKRLRQHSSIEDAQRWVNGKKVRVFNGIGLLTTQTTQTTQTTAEQAKRLNATRTGGSKG